MNKAKRKKIMNIVEQISSMTTRLECIAGEINLLSDDEAYKLENMPENLEGSAQYDSIENAADHLSDAYQEMESALAKLLQVMEDLEAAL